MSRWEAAALSALLALSGPCALRSQARTEINIDHSLMQRLDSVADTATVEHFRCLVGVWAAPTELYVVGAYAPAVRSADYNHVTPVAECQGAHDVGEWHNHLPYAFPMILDPIGQRIAVEPVSVCEMSPQDRRSAAHGPDALRVSVISVVRGVHCAWYRTKLKDERAFARLPWRLP